MIEHRRTHTGMDLSILAYLLESGSDRIGAFDFQESATRYTARSGDAASLEELAEAADRQRLWGRQFLNPYALYGYNGGAAPTG